MSNRSFATARRRPLPVPPCEDAPVDRPARPALQAIREDKDQIIEAMLLQARKGSYLHAKFLFDFAGIHTAEEADAAQHPSLVQFLLEKLELEPDPRAEDASDA